MKIICIAIFTVCIVALAACEDEGTFDVKVEFPGEHPDGNHWAYVKIYQQDSSNTQRKIVMVPPTLFRGTNVNAENVLEIPKVPSGDNYQLTIELKKEKNALAPSMYFGKSRHFSVASGNHEELLVSLNPVDEPIAIRITRAESNIDSQTHTEAFIDTDTAVADDSIPQIDNIYYLNSDRAKIEVAVKESWQKELALNRVDFASSDDFSKNYHAFKKITEPKDPNVPFWANEMVLPFDTNPQSLFAKVFDQTYGLVLFGKIRFVVDKGIPEPVSAFCADLKYAKEDFSCSIEIKNYNQTTPIEYADSDYSTDADMNAGSDEKMDDTIEAFCDNSAPLQNPATDTDMPALCGEDVSCTVEITDTTDSFKVECRIKNESIDCMCLLAVSSTDIAGNTHTEQFSWVKVDNVAPESVSADIVAQITRNGDTETVEVKGRDRLQIKADETITIQGEFNEPLQSVLFKVGESDVAGGLTTDGRHFWATYAVKQGDRNGDCTIEVTATDLAGNVSTQTYEQTVHVNTSLPRCEPSDPLGDILVDVGEPYGFELNVSEELSRWNVKIGDKDITSECRLEASRKKVICGGTVQPEDSEGEKKILVTMWDLAENQQSQTITDPKIVFEFEHPKLITSSASTKWINHDRKVTFDFVFSEEMYNCKIESALFATPQILETLNSEKHEYKGEYLIGKDIPDGDYEVKLVECTNVNNISMRTDPADIHVVTLDVVEPEISDMVVSKKHVSKGDAITFDFAVSEPLNDLEVRIGDDVVRGNFNTNCDTDLLTCHFIHIVNATAGDDGEQTIFIESTDLAGNANIYFSKNSIAYDFTAPSVMGEPTVSLSEPIDADTEADSDTSRILEIDFDVSEPLGHIAVSVGGLTLDGALEDSCETNESGTLNCRISHKVNELIETEGDKTISIDMTDLAGNFNSQKFENLVKYEFDYPYLLGMPDVSSSLVGNRKQFLVSFNVSEKLRDIAVRIAHPVSDNWEELNEAGIKDDTGNILHCKTDQICHFSYTFNVDGDCTVKAEDQKCKGEADVQIEMTDLAGIKKTHTSQNLVKYDFLPPTLASSTIEPKIATDGENVTVKFSFSEPINPDSQQLSFGELGVNNPSVSTDDNSLWTATFTINDADAQGVYPLSLTNVSDVAGNVAPAMPLGTLRVLHTVYVDDNNVEAEGDDEGVSWSSAYNNLARALMDAPKGTEIWIAAGTYLPDTNGDVTAAFQLKEGHRVYGGFESGDTDFLSRNLNFDALKSDEDSLSTILDGDNTVHHVVTGASNATLDGVVIRNGKAIGIDSGANDGAGIYIDNAGEPFALRNCLVKDNHADNFGGGLLAYDAEVTIQNCVFRANSANDGGAVYADNALLRVSQSVFDDNYIFGGDGGGMAIYYSNSTLIVNCMFTDNSAGGEGGAIYSNNTYAGIYNGVFFGNDANYGGAVYAAENTTIDAAHCTFHHNQASALGDDIHLGDENGEGRVRFDNSIFWYGADTDSECTAPIEPVDHGGIYVYSSNMFGCGSAPIVHVINPVTVIQSITIPVTKTVTVSKPVTVIKTVTLIKIVTLIKTVVIVKMDTDSDTDTDTATDTATDTMTDTVTDTDTATDTDTVTDTDTDTVTDTDTATDTDTVDWAYCTDCIYENPLFIHPYGDPDSSANIDLSLQADSPCINSGDETLWPFDYLHLDSDTSKLQPFDINGNNRCLPETDTFCRVDMGAYEH
ncbi:MAG: right-handed parallel beta-helix repeat-containing protein [Deltaproteobacteria bacterium]|nr:right-handed parallel beta-helix repeat-containing protein [Deltaproteobacteria bacterium]